jgi:hypothetical protein
MAAQDIQAELLGWALDETQKQCFGEDFGVAVSFGLVPINPQQVLPVWQLVITARNPILGQGPLFHAKPIGDPRQAGMHTRPSEETVRAEVGEGLRLLRALAASMLGKSNGKPIRLLPG